MALLLTVACRLCWEIETGFLSHVTPKRNYKKSLIISEATQNKTYTMLAPVRLSESEKVVCAIAPCGGKREIFFRAGNHSLSFVMPKKSVQRFIVRYQFKSL